MARSKFQEGPKYVSPVGKLVWPHLNTPRQFEGAGKFSYDCCVDFEGSDGEKMQNFVKDYAKDYSKRCGGRVKVDSILVDAVEKDDSGELQDLPGVTRVKFKVSNLETSRGTWDRKPAFYDLNGEPMVPEPMIGGGTLAQVTFTVYEWKGASHGMTLQPKALRIHKLVEYVPREESESAVIQIGSSTAPRNVETGGHHPADF